MAIELPVLNNLTFDEKPQDKCGVVGLIDFGDNGSIHRAVAALSAVNHRGSDMAGMATRNGGIHRSRGFGKVKNTFTEKRITSADLEGPLTVGHTRYKTQGGKSLAFAQPTIATHEGRTIALAHNGNIPDVEPLVKKLQERGIRVRKKFDSSLLAQLIVSAEGESWIEKVQNGLEGVFGSYSLTMLTDDGHLVAVRDPWGNRPISAAEMDNGVVVSSESKSFPLVRAKFRKELEPGQILDFSKEGMQSSELLEKAQKRMCIFEEIYFAHETSIINGKSVAKFRKELGKILARKHKAAGDVVTAIPESSSVAALAYAQESGKELDRLILKEENVDRTFMAGEMKERTSKVETKYVIQPDIKGRSVDMVDDSVVIGNTIRILAANLRENYDVVKMHVLSTAPPIRRDCRYGVNMRSSDGEFVAAGKNGGRRSDKEIAKSLGVTSVRYTTISDLREVARKVGVDPDTYCYECFGGPGLKPAILKAERPQVVPFSFEKAS